MNSRYQGPETTSAPKNRNLKVVAKQLLVEFWLPLIIAISWVALSSWLPSNNRYAPLIKDGFTTFALAAWLTGQFFRVAKQARNENSLGEIERKADHLLCTLDHRINDVLNQMTGGQTFPYLEVSQIDHERDNAHLLIMSEGNTNLYDLVVRVTDLTEWSSYATGVSPLGFIKANRAVNLLGHGYMTPIDQVPFSGDTFQVFRADITARNGGFEQIIQLVKANDQWHRAIRVRRLNSAEILKCEADQAFLVATSQTLELIDWQRIK